MKVLTNIIRFILMVILTITIITFSIITIVSSTILDKNYIISKLEETNFYEETYKLVESNFENYIYQSGLDETVLENICSQEKVKEDVNIILSNIYDGTNQKIDTTVIADNLNNNIDKLGIKTSKNASAIDKFVDHICEEYEDTVIHTSYEDNLNNAYSKIIKIGEKVTNLTTITFVIALVLMTIISIKCEDKNVRNIGISLFAAGTFDIIVNKIILSKVNISGIKIFNDAFSKSLVTIIQDVLSQILKSGITIMILGLVFIIIYAIIQLFKKDKSKLQTEEK